MLRIIAGKYRSRLLKQPRREITRPTIDRAREAIFSSIQFNIENKIFLDLFSGSGAFCLEALSRGAKKGICIEKNYEAYQVILENKNSLKEENLLVKNTDALRYLNSLTDEKFDYIYLDPPFKDKELLLACLDIISSKNLLNEGGFAIIETDWDNLVYNTNNYIIQKSKKYGKIYIYYITK
ncbi:16S rRNA (guanine(966)-N(2))-methyltransferase RsmD [Mycoplasma struthionis]|uniref:16S rRNA (Guanine(966)-N(2))-methyltransferase RsmD n=1 Tax=Mycoplasma struthionis TaxID=538220 RepID=A0A3G8LGB7_9MOLU|nr:16S rRNA (guanine(966)-N(2))-methyltransferase RsmD [Mycoplasma struthionis]AZG68551.1 16S rRNA (guanine(966)-N(2))-methyltransferase RsmD [Mycoplasma struthionis]TPI02381.1 16S rRNA (guanine(966)-N(2))-methyltransferase RsmD [Mycoplasma struthionis]